MEPKELIAALGGPTAVARHLGVEPNTVGNWYQRVIPNWAKPKLIELCDRLGVDPKDALDSQPPRQLKRVAG